jgi:hypothetical protein
MDSRVGHAANRKSICGAARSVDFTDNLHGVVQGLDGDSPQHPIPLATSDGGKTWSVRLKD